MSFRLSARSRARLQGVHPALTAVVEAAIARTPVDFMITEGLRTAARQAALVKAGASRTTRSRHLTGHAVDVAALAPATFASVPVDGGRHLLLLLYAVSGWTGEPRAIEASALRWGLPADLASLPMPPADIPLLAALSLSGLSLSRPHPVRNGR